MLYEYLPLHILVKTEYSLFLLFLPKFDSG